jgi:hypothetical protein
MSPAPREATLAGLAQLAAQAQRWLDRHTLAERPVAICSPSDLHAPFTGLASMLDCQAKGRKRGMGGGAGHSASLTRAPGSLNDI